MRRITYGFILLFFSATFLCAETKPAHPLSAEHQKWMDVVHWIISDYERDAFLALDTEDARNRFIESFWDNRDPTPGTKQNEFKEEHYARFEYANKFYGRESTLPGWKTDRGRLWIIMGKPELIKRIPASHDNHPMELWHYIGYKGYGLPSSLYLLFYQQYGTGAYRLYSPMQDTIRNLFIQTSPNSEKVDRDLYADLRENVDPEVAFASISSIPSEGADPSYLGSSIGTEVVMAKIQNVRNYDVSRRKYVEDILNDRPSVKVYYSIFTEGIRDALYWFQAPTGDYYIDYAVEYEPNKLDMGQYEQYYTSLTVDGLVATPDRTEVDQIIGTHEIKLTEEQFNKIRSIPFQFQGRRPLVPGKYVFTLILSNNVSQKSSTFVKDIFIPDVATGKSPVITPPVPIRSVENAPQDGKVRPFQFGDKVLIPNVPAQYTQKSSMYIYHQVLFPDQYLGGNHLSLQYVVNSGGKMETTSTDPLQVDTNELAGNFLELRKEIATNGLSIGEKELIIELHDGDKVVAKSNPIVFNIGTEAISGSWKFGVALPSFDSGFHRFVEGQQLLKQNKTKEAMALLEEAHLKNPDSLEITFVLMRAALKAENFTRALELGNPIEIKNPRNQEVMYLMGWAYYGQKNYEEAVKMFERLRIEDEKRIDVLNLLAEIYYRMDRRDKSLERIQQSLAVKPDQKDLLALKQKIESNR